MKTDCSFPPIKYTSVDRARSPIAVVREWQVTAFKGLRDDRMETSIKRPWTTCRSPFNDICSKGIRVFLPIIGEKFLLTFNRVNYCNITIFDDRREYCALDKWKWKKSSEKREKKGERIFVDGRIFFFVVINLCSRRFKILINILCRTWKENFQFLWNRKFSYFHDFRKEKKYNIKSNRIN